jgi:DNA-binding LytR/AlgR family response regulator
MFKINCLIVDDEPFALSLIEGYVNRIPFLELKGKCSSALQAVEAMKQQQIDLIFLDIQMPDLDGMSLSHTLKEGPRVIFTTAFEKYAVEGYKVNAVDYLLKPFNFEEFLQAVYKARIILEEKARSKEMTADSSSYLFIKSEYRKIRVNLNNVLYFEGLKDYVKIYKDNSAKPTLSLMSLKSLEKSLPPNFMRVHRSFIVNLEKVDAVERSQIIISNQRINIAPQYCEEFNQYIASKSIIIR